MEIKVINASDEVIAEICGENTEDRYDRVIFLGKWEERYKIQHHEQ